MEASASGSGFSGCTFIRSDAESLDLDDDRVSSRIGAVLRVMATAKRSHKAKSLVEGNLLLCSSEAVRSD